MPSVSLKARQKKAGLPLVQPTHKLHLDYLDNYEPALNLYEDGYHCKGGPNEKTAYNLHVKMTPTLSLLGSKSAKVSLVENMGYHQIDGPVKRLNWEFKIPRIFDSLPSPHFSQVGRCCRFYGARYTLSMFCPATQTVKDSMGMITGVEHLVDNKTGKFEDILYIAKSEVPGPDGEPMLGVFAAKTFYPGNIITVLAGNRMEATPPTPIIQNSKTDLVPYNDSHPSEADDPPTEPNHYMSFPPIPMQGVDFEMQQQALRDEGYGSGESHKKKKIPGKKIPDSEIPDSKITGTKNPDSKNPDSKIPDSKIPSGSPKKKKIPVSKTPVKDFLAENTKSPGEDDFIPKKMHLLAGGHFIRDISKIPADKNISANVELRNFNYVTAKHGLFAGKELFINRTALSVHQFPGKKKASRKRESGSRDDGKSPAKQQKSKDAAYVLMANKALDAEKLLREKAEREKAEAEQKNKDLMACLAAIEEKLNIIPASATTQPIIPVAESQWAEEDPSSEDEDEDEQLIDSQDAANMISQDTQAVKKKSNKRKDDDDEDDN
jgi:hypothetical protein